VRFLLQARFVSKETDKEAKVRLLDLLIPVSLIVKVDVQRDITARLRYPSSLNRDDLLFSLSLSLSSYRNTFTSECPFEIERTYRIPAAMRSARLFLRASVCHASENAQFSDWKPADGKKPELAGVY